MLPAARAIDAVVDSLLPAAWTAQVPGLTATKPVTLANFRLDASLVVPAVTVTVSCSNDAWMMRTSALPRGVRSLSPITWSLIEEYGPIPATV
jgi:hypothetical protein